MRLQMGGIDHQIVRLAAPRGQFGQDAVEYPQSAPSDEAVVDGLVRTVARRRIPPAKSIADHEQDAAQHPPIVDPRDAMRKGEVGLNPPHLRGRKHQQISQGSTSMQP